MKRSFVFGRILAFGLIMLMLVGMIPMVSVSAEENTTKDGFVYEITGNEVTITDYIGDAVDLVIPQKIDKKPVTSIGEYAFEFCESLENILIPEGVESIGKKAFDFCSSLESITISEGVKNIGEKAFAYCSSLESITIPETVESIGEYAFYRCESLERVVIPEGVESIGEDVFGWCESLDEIKVDADNKFYDSRENCNAIIETATNTLVLGCKNTAIPESVESIGAYAFGGCNSLESLVIPEGVEDIGDNAFYLCESIGVIKVDADNKVYDSRENSNAIIETATNTLILGCKNTVIPVGVESIGYGAFASCIELKSLIIPESVESIGEYAFYWCESLESIIISEGVKGIGEGAFADCSSLESITIPETVESIGYGAFAYCESLENVIIPESVESIGKYAFDGCYALTDVYYAGTQEQWEESFADVLRDSSNDEPYDVTMHYNYAAEEESEDEDLDKVPENTDKVYDNFAGEVQRVENKDKDDNLVLIIALCIGGGLILGAGIVLVTVAIMKKKTTAPPVQNTVPQVAQPVQIAGQTYAEPVIPVQQVNETAQQDE